MTAPTDTFERIGLDESVPSYLIGARYKQIAVTAAGGSLPAGTETTLYLGGLYEKVTKPSGVIEHKHYLMAGKEAIAIRTLRSNSVNDTRYLHKDHLGSVDTITNEAGAVVQRLSYDAFGKRRNATAWAGALTAGDWTSIAAITHRAFTFHEQLDNVDLVHMNGRVYDPNLGRFISADPFIQAPLLSQSLNRYSYVMNNPLSLVDPSGYSWLSKAWKKLGRAFGKIIKAIGQVVASVVVVVVVAAVCFYSWEEGGCGPAIVQGAAWLSAIWGPGGGGGGPSNSQRGPPSIFLPPRAAAPTMTPAGALLLGPPQANEDTSHDQTRTGVVDVRASRGVIGRDSSERDESDDSGNDEPPAGVGEAKQGVSWLGRIRQFLGISGKPAANAAVRTAGQVINTGISALDVDVAQGIAAINILANLNTCVAAGNCYAPEDLLLIRGYLGESPPNYRKIAQVFIDRRWNYRSGLELLKERQK